MRNDLDRRVGAIEDRFKAVALRVRDDWFDDLLSNDKDLIVRWAEAALETPSAPFDWESLAVGFSSEENERVAELLADWRAKVCREMSNGRR